MRWLREHGVISNYDDYTSLPAAVLDDARIYMQVEGEHMHAEAKRSEAALDRAQRGLKRGIGR